MSLPSGMLIREPHPLIHVRWEESLDPAARGALEREFGLDRGEQLDRRTWRYEATDTSRDAIGRIVGSPSVADTHYVDRNTFAIDSAAPRAAQPRHLAFFFVILAAVAALGAARPQRLSPAAIRAFVVRGIPPLSVHGLAIFRLVFGLTLALYVYAQPFPREVMSADRLRPDIQFADVGAIRWLVEHPQIVRAGQSLAIASAAGFALGIVPRVLYAVTVAGMLQWLIALSLQSDGHPFGVLILPLLCLLVVPWGDAPPLFGTRAPARAPAPALATARYGYAPWLLGFALGVAWAAAAWAKLREGPGWVINGTVRYHFVSDASQAPVDWGLTVATMPALAVALSAGGVLVEGLALPAAFVRAPALRLAMGLAGMSLLGGFYVFQGLFWPAWWILLLGCVPWEWFDRSAGAAAGSLQSRQVSHAQLLCIGGLALQQLVTSAFFIEIPPVASRYDMYSKTHASTADYDRENPDIRRRLMAEEAQGRRTDVTSCAGDMHPGSPPPSLATLQACLPGDATPARYLLLEDRCPFDWHAGRRSCAGETLIATLPVAP